MLRMHFLILIFNFNLCLRVAAWVTVPGGHSIRSTRLKNTDIQMGDTKGPGLRDEWRGGIKRRISDDVSTDKHNQAKIG